MDPTILKATWLEAQEHGDEFVIDFYSRLFLANPGVRDLFPADMRGQRVHLRAILNLVVRSADNLDAIIPRLQQLGSDHHSYGAVAAHFPAVKAALLETLEHFLGDDWADEVAKEWGEAIDVVSGVMIAAAEQQPPTVWALTVAAVHRHDDRVAVEFHYFDHDNGPVGQTAPVALTQTGPNGDTVTAPGTWRDVALGRSAADRLCFEIPVTIDDTISLHYGDLQPDDTLHLRAPIAPLTSEEAH